MKRDEKVKEQILNLIRKATKEFAEKNKFTIPGGAFPKQLEGIQNARKLGNLNDGQFKAFLSIMSHVDKVEYKFEELDTFNKAAPAVTHWPKFAAVVPVRNEAGHNYTLQVLAIVSRPGERSYLIRQDGSYGNTIDQASLNNRPATDEEINAITAYQLETIKRDLVVVV